MFRYLMLAGLALFLPGLCALGYSLYEGPSSWMLDSRTFWGMPISLFVFWVGLAHAGTLLSAVFLALDIKLDRRTALIAELSTLASLVFAGIFPLMHLGYLQNFYMVAPFLDARGNFANVSSPLVWDFCCIAVYAILSLLFFVMHLKARVNPALDKYRKPMAWLLFPLVLWVHTVVSLDFATTFVPEWRGAFFPVYFIAGAIFSGIALVNLLLCTERAPSGTPAADLFLAPLRHLVLGFSAQGILLCFGIYFCGRPSATSYGIGLPREPLGPRRPFGECSFRLVPRTLLPSFTGVRNLIVVRLD